MVRYHSDFIVYKGRKARYFFFTHSQGRFKKLMDPMQQNN